MPDARLAITSLVNTYPLSSESGVNDSLSSTLSLQSTSSSSSSLLTHTKKKSTRIGRDPPCYSTSIQLHKSTVRRSSATQSRAQLQANSNLNLNLLPIQVPSCSQRSEPASTSVQKSDSTVSVAFKPPQTMIVKTPRGKRHRCTFTGCGRDFTRLSNLKAHWRRHSGEEPYSCVHCGRKFKWRSSLKSHELGCVFSLNPNQNLNSNSTPNPVVSSTATATGFSAEKWESDPPSIAHMSVDASRNIHNNGLTNRKGTIVNQTEALPSTSSRHLRLATVTDLATKPATTAGYFRESLDDTDLMYIKKGNVVSLDSMGSVNSKSQDGCFDVKRRSNELILPQTLQLPESRPLAYSSERCQYYEQQQQRPKQEYEMGSRPQLVLPPPPFPFSRMGPAA